MAILPAVLQRAAMMNLRSFQRNALASTTLILACLALVACVETPPQQTDSDSPAQLAQAAFKRGDHAAAAELTKQAIERDPQNIALRRDLGRFYMMLDNPGDAREAYKAALAIDGADPKALNGLGVALDQLGDHEGAVRQFESALKIEPANLATINNLAYASIQAGHYSDAIKRLEPHVKAAGATPALRRNLALAYGLAGMDVDAERVAKMDLSPAQVKANMLYYKQRRAELAVSSTPYADLGSYATEAMASAQIRKLQEQMEGSGVDLKPVIAPEVTTPGGTPRFAVRMMGCTKPSDVETLCQTLEKSGVPCIAKGRK